MTDCVYLSLKLRKHRYMFGTVHFGKLTIIILEWVKHSDGELNLRSSTFHGVYFALDHLIALSKNTLNL